MTPRPSSASMLLAAVLSFRTVPALAASPVLMGGVPVENSGSPDFWPLLLASLVILSVTAVLINSFRQSRDVGRENLLKLEDLEQFFETSQDLLCIASLDGRFLRLNPAWEKTLGYTLLELEGLGYMNLVHPDDREATANAALELAQGRYVKGFVNRYRRKDGQYRFIEWDTAPLSGKIYATARDVTTWRVAQTQLRESEERFRTLLDTIEAVSVQGYWPDGTVRYWNSASETVYGYTREEAIGHDLVELIIPEAMREEVRQAIANMARTGQPVPASELTLMHKDGSQVQVFSSHAVVRTASGEIMLFCLDVDVAPLKKAQQAVRCSEERLRSLVENAGDAIYLTDMKGRFLEVNPEAERQSGYSRDELLNMSVLDLDVNRSHSNMETFVADIPRTHRTTFETLHRTRSGKLLPVELKVVYLESEGLPMMMGIARDISTRKRADEALSEANRVLATVLDSIPAEVNAVDVETYEILFMNKRMKQTYKRDCTGETCFRAFRKYDSPCPSCSIPALLDPMGKPAGSVAWEDFNPVLSRWNINHDKAVRWLDGRLVRVQVAMDITERRNTEEAMVRSLEEKELMLKEIHHRVKNNLQIISSLLSLQEGCVEHPEARTALTDSIHRVFSMAAIHEQLYHSGDFRAIDVKAYLETLLSRLASACKGERSIEILLEAAPCQLTLEQAIPYGLIMNELATNAFKHGFANRQEGTIRVSVGIASEEISTVVENDGEDLPGGFDPDTATTLGMQLVCTLVSQLGGALTAGGPRGARFEVRFPLLTPY